jgi:starch-binding outer membrane protein, SusD/RagB family
MSAELHLEDNLVLAQTYFDMVRNRAFANPAAHHIALSNDAAGIKAIMDERRWELALENCRYWDLLRQGMDVAKATIDCSVEVQSGGATVPLVINFRKETNGLLKIPETQISLTGGLLKQNPGWE